MDPQNISSGGETTYKRSGKFESVDDYARRRPSGTYPEVWASKRHESATGENSTGVAHLDEAVEDTYQQLPEKPEVWPPKKNDNFKHHNPADDFDKIKGALGDEKVKERSVKDLAKMELEDPEQWSIFIAGSIEQGKAIQWQPRMIESLQDLPITVYNPRAGEWKTTGNDEENARRFEYQVKWELERLENATMICFFFDAMTFSPVTMLEFGLWTGKQKDKVVVACDTTKPPKDKPAPRFWRGNNVKEVAQREKIPLVNSFAELVSLVRERAPRAGSSAHGESNPA